jgi:hypothetical protein
MEICPDSVPVAGTAASIAAAFQVANSPDLRIGIALMLDVSATSITMHVLVR